MFKTLTPLPDQAPELLIDGTPLPFLPGSTVAEALLRHNRLACRRHPVDQRERGPFCLMGSCFECLVQIDGRPDQQACMVMAASGMRVDTGLDTA